MKVFVITDVKFELRAGNYVHYRLPEGLHKQGVKVLFSSPITYRWKSYTEVDTSPFTFVPYERWMDALSECDLVIWFSNPGGWWIEATSFIDTLYKTTKPSLCYYALDYWEGWMLGQKQKEIYENERKLVERSSYIVAVSPQLCSYLSARYGRKVVWIPNASIPFPPIKHDKKQKVVLIVSSFCHVRRCVADIVRVALAHPDWLFVWCGGDNAPYRPKFPSYNYPSNLLLLGERENSEVLRWAEVSSLAIVPAGRNWFSYFADPTKWYLYHMWELPIISLHTPHHQKYPSFYPSTVAGWDAMETFKKAITNPPIPSKPKQFHTWEHRTESFLKYLLRDEVVYGYAEGGKFHFTF